MIESGDIEKIRPVELRQLIYEHYGIRVPPSLPSEILREIIEFKTELSEISNVENPYNLMRDAILTYIEENQGRLSLPCDGNCYNHTDLVVFNCYVELQRELNEQT